MGIKSEDRIKNLEILIVSLQDNINKINNKVDSTLAIINQVIADDTEEEM